MRHAIALCALLLCACDTMQRASSTLFGGEAETRPAQTGLEAPLIPRGGSAASGSVRFTARGDAVTMLVHVDGLHPGQYRVLVHETGNCSSPNAFSAGPPWSPPGSAAPLYERLPTFSTSSEGTGTMTVRVSGVAIGMLSGRSVVVHDTPNGPFTTEPDVRNGRVACGVIGPLRSLF